MLVILNNRDSFVFNLDRYFRELGEETCVLNSHEADVEYIKGRNPKAIIISPGPCTPDEAGVSLSAVRRFAGSLPILGVCLGHQVIGQIYGGTIKRANNPLYGQAAPIAHSGKGIFSGLPNPLSVGLYHSLIVEEQADCAFRVEARSETGEIMALRHPDHPTFGIQFHPESVLSEAGHALLANFLEQVRQHA